MFPSETPKEDPGSRRVRRWVYQCVPNGASVVGWLAGEPRWIKCHHVGVSRGCRRWLSESKLQCPYCESKIDLVWRGYTPFYDESLLRKFVLLAEDQQESASLIRHLSPIRISRGKQRKTACTIKADVWRTAPLPEDSERCFGVDLAPVLLLMWKDEELNLFFRDKKKQQELDFIAKSLGMSGAPPKAIPGQMGRQFRKRVKQEETIGDLIPMLGVPSSNGDGGS